MMTIPICYISSISYKKENEYTDSYKKLLEFIPYLNLVSLNKIYNTCIDYLFLYYTYQILNHYLNLI